MDLPGCAWRRSRLTRGAQELVALAAAVLRGEPRSVYRRTKCSAESYGFSLDGVDIVTECVAAVLFLLLPTDAQGQGKRAAVKSLLRASSPCPHAPFNICLCRKVCFAQPGAANRRRSLQCPSLLTSVVHVTKVRPLADRVREVQQQMSAALLTGGGDARGGVQEGQAEDNDNGGSKRSRAHASDGQ